MNTGDGTIHNALNAQTDYFMSLMTMEQLHSYAKTMMTFNQN